MIGEDAVLAIGEIKQKSEEYEDILVEIIVNCTGRSDDFLQGYTEKNLREGYSSSNLGENFIPDPPFIRDTRLRIKSIFALGMIGDSRAAKPLIEQLLLKLDLWLVHFLQKDLDSIKNSNSSNSDEFILDNSLDDIKEFSEEIITIESRINSLLSSQDVSKKLNRSNIEIGHLHENLLLHTILESLEKLIQINGYSEIIDKGLKQAISLIQVINDYDKKYPTSLNAYGHLKIRRSKLFTFSSEFPTIRFDDIKSLDPYLGFNTLFDYRSKRKEFSLHHKTEKILQKLSQNQKTDNSDRDFSNLRRLHSLNRWE